MSESEPRVTPLMRQYRDVKKMHPDAILLFRMGDFYEMFEEDARIAAPILDIVLTSRDKNSDDKTPMCGVPHHSVDVYIAKLISKNYKVAICDQLEDPKTAKGIVKRGVVRVMTPGTLLESNLLESKSNNFIASLAHLNNRTGAALLDMSTGEFQVTEREGDDSSTTTLAEIMMWSPRELILSHSSPLQTVNDGCSINRQDDWIYSIDYSRRMLLEHFKTTNLEGYGIESMPAAIIAAGALLHYLQITHVQDLSHITSIRYFHQEEFVYIDPASRRNLELTKTLMQGTREGSLIHFIDATQTAMGGRMLRRRLEQPLRDPASINQRLDEVEAFYQDDGLRSNIRNYLARMTDLERLIGRVVTGVANARDLAALRDSLEIIPQMVTLLQESNNSILMKISHPIDPVDGVKTLLQKSIVDNPPLSLKEGNIIRDNFDPDLDQYKSAAKDGKSWIASLQTKERARTQIPSLKVSYNRVFGYYIEVTNTHLSKIPEDYIRRQTLTNGERYVTPELKEMEEKILGAEEKMAALEFDLFVSIRQKVALEVVRIQQTSRAIAEIDAASALAEIASHRRYRRPLVDDSDIISITGGRHPVVEQFPGSEGFVPNDVHLDCTDNRLLILTGPNMAGKSTYIRQVALLIIMAQMGSFIPALEAHVGVVDRIFTRVGASDNLAGGQSTFMVEMNEAANILNNATPQSLIILDEIGRGTSTFDGLSIAWSVAEYLHELSARTLFATHYHELTDLSDRLSGVKNYNVAVKEWNDQVIFLRSVVPGGVDRSYGIQVARLAGIPAGIINRAKEVLSALESKEQSRVPSPQKKDTDKINHPIQLTLFNPLPPILDEIRKLDLDQLKPLDALLLIAQWKKQID